jgi:hypothetical protein
MTLYGYPRVVWGPGAALSGATRAEVDKLKGYPLYFTYFRNPPFIKSSLWLKEAVIFPL